MSCFMLALAVVDRRFDTKSRLEGAAETKPKLRLALNHSPILPKPAQQCSAYIVHTTTAATRYPPFATAMPMRAR